MTTFGIDASSFQGAVNWAQVDASTEFGAEKVTEGANYLNPFWAAARPALRARALASGFVPMAYLFMDAGPSGAAQADWFHQNAGTLDDFGIAVDLERAPDGSPTIQSARECVARLRELYPGHPVGGYGPHWYTGSADLTFFDWTWASEYVSGTGSPEMLYRQVPEAWWAPYGGMTPLLLQFTSSAVVPGVSGPVDCSAYKGTAAELRSAVLPGHAAPPPPASTRSDEVFIILTPGETAVSFPVWAGAAEVKGAPVAFHYASLHLTGDTGATVKAVLWDKTGTASTKAFALTTGHRLTVDIANASVVSLKRADKNLTAGASARLVNW